MIVTELLEAQRAAVEASFDSALAITGAAGTGKTAALHARARRFATEFPGAAYRILRHPSELAAIARERLRSAGCAIELVDDVEALARFRELALPLLEMEWEEIISGAIDPEVPGLRSPQRFVDAAFRLIAKLRDAGIPATAFLESSLSAATAFYANPPNFASPELILATKDVYRDSLDVERDELARQYRREVDLAKILARLYSAYERDIASSHRMTAGDAVLEAAALTEPLREHLFIDEAQEGTGAQRAFLESLLGPELRGLTLAGDPSAPTSTFRGARPDRMFASIAPIELKQQLRSAAGPDPLVLYRPRTQREEARYIADVVRSSIDAGLPPHEIALIFRSTCDVHVYEDALLDRDVPVAVYGDVNVFEDPRALDALALLWNLWNPFAHAWMLRTLEGRFLNLSDAAIAALCAEPPDSQATLFTFEDEPAPTERTRRWDPKRDLRLGWNVTRGDVDSSLDAESRQRVEAFRSARREWIAAMPGRSLAALARRIWGDALAAAGPPYSARYKSQQFILQRLLHRLEGHALAHSGATLGDVLGDAEARAESDLETAYGDLEPGYVPLLNVDAAGSFPRWYVPDAFMWSPKLGMIPKENAGDARAARTAKFSYYMHRAKARENYNAEERRAFVYAMRRARTRVYVTAYDRATRGTTAPEFFEELRSARLPGTRVE
jgi:superfamily I DNA/RNA helicase